jgi:hypothetical protein
MICGICGSDNVRGGSWTPDRCLNCGASNALDDWYFDEDARPTIAEIRKKSNYGLQVEARE